MQYVVTLIRNLCNRSTPDSPSMHSCERTHYEILGVQCPPYNEFTRCLMLSGDGKRETRRGALGECIATHIRTKEVNFNYDSSNDEVL